MCFINIVLIKPRNVEGIPLVVQWLGLCSFTTGGVGSNEDLASYAWSPPTPQKKKAKPQRCVVILMTARHY